MLGALGLLLGALGLLGGKRLLDLGVERCVELLGLGDLGLVLGHLRLGHLDLVLLAGLLLLELGLVRRELALEAVDLGDVGGALLADLVEVVDAVDEVLEAGGAHQGVDHARGAHLVAAAHVGAQGLAALRELGAGGLDLGAGLGDLVAGVLEALLGLHELGLDGRDLLAQLLQADLRVGKLALERLALGRELLALLGELVGLLAELLGRWVGKGRHGKCRQGEGAREKRGHDAEKRGVLRWAGHGNLASQVVRLSFRTR